MSNRKLPEKSKSLQILQGFAGTFKTGYLCRKMKHDEPLHIYP